MKLLKHPAFAVAIKGSSGLLEASYAPNNARPPNTLPIPKETLLFLADNDNVGPSVLSEQRVSKLV